MHKTVTKALLECQSREKKDAFKVKKNRKWINIDWKSHFKSCENIGSALLKLGVNKGDRVCILSSTRYEWACIDLGVLGIGAVSVPIYESNRPDEVEYIINDCEAKILFCENEKQLEKWKSIQQNCPSIMDVVVIDSKGESKSHQNYDSFKELGAEHLKTHPNNFKDFCDSVVLDDMASIIYTSGTTGRPKGVVLTHHQIASEVVEVFQLLNVDDNDSTLSFLPFAHVFGRVEMWGNIYVGYSMAFAESIEKIKYNLVEIKPTLLIAVPRIFEKIYNGILNQANSHPVRSKVFNWAIGVGKKVSQKKVEKKAISLPLLAQYKLARTAVFDKILEKLGGRIRFSFSGGAPLNGAIAEFFHATGLLILEGYGLTETTAGITVNSPLDYKFGTVGKPIGDTQIKIANDGEILVKSRKVMKEYFNNPEATEEVFTEGYFHTGDIGEFDDDGFLKITDRKKDLIKTAGGKYVAPQKLEGLLKLSPLISNVLIHGDQRKYIVALVTLDEDGVKSFALENNISFSSVESLSKNSKIKSVIRDAVAEANSELASFETIKNFDILPSDFTIESGELTPSLKVKRKVCDKKYQDTINLLYGEDRSAL